MFRILELLVSLSAALLFMVVMAGATTYRYVDANGTTCYADDLSSVPSQFQSRVVIVVDKQTKSGGQDRVKSNSVQTVPEKSGAGSTESTTFLRPNFLFLGGLLVVAILLAYRVQKSGRLELAIRIQAISVVLCLCLAAVINHDITSSIAGAVHAGYAKIRDEMKAQEERDKKPLKTLSEKVDEMMQQIQK